MKVNIYLCVRGIDLAIYTILIFEFRIVQIELQF